MSFSTTPAVNFGNVVAGSSSLPSGTNTTYFFASWAGWIIPVVTGLYTIGVNSEDGCDLTLCGQKFIADLTVTQAAQSSPTYTQSFQIYLTAGVYYDIILEWQHGTGANFECQLLWTPPTTTTPALIPLGVMSDNSYSVSQTFTSNFSNGNTIQWYVPTGVINPWAFTGPWSSTTPYGPGMIVTYSGSTWIALSNNTNSAPSGVNAHWQEFGGGGGATALSDLTDVYINPSVGPNDKDVLTWSSSLGEWTNEPVSSLPAAPPVGTLVSSATGTLASNGTANATLTMAKMFSVYKVNVNYPARVRLYSTAAARTADASRPNSIPPTPGTQHGVIADLYLDTADKYTWICSPVIEGANVDGTQVASVYAAVTNLDTVSRNITTTIYFVSQES